MSQIFKALDEAGKTRSKSEPPKVSLRTKVGLPQMVVGSRTSNSAEEFDRLRLHLSGMFPAMQSKVLMFVSPSEAEDNAKVVASFGYMLAWVGESAVLVDANRQNSQLHIVLGTDQGPGVSELLSGNATVLEVLRDTDVSELRLVPGGLEATSPLSDSEIAALRGSLDVLRASTDWIIFRAPSVSAGSDFAALSRMVDGVVMVIGAEKTRWEDAIFAKEQLQKAGANILGAIFTGRKTRIPVWLERLL